MKIAIDTRHFCKNKDDRYSFYLLQILKRVTAENTTDDFIFFFDRPVQPDISFDKNVSFVFTGPVTSNPLLLKLWYDIKIPALLKKYGVDVFVAGPGICSLRTRVPQCMILDDLSYLHFEVLKKSTSFFLRRYIKKFIHTAGSIITVSSYLRNEINRLSDGNDKKVMVIHGAGSSIKLTTSKEVEAIREKYTSGKNYFLFTGEIDQRKNMVNLLKAFSIFKRRQKSDWKLVLAGNISTRFKSFYSSVSTYKYRDEVIILAGTGVEEISKLISAAYAFVYPAVAEGWSAAIYDAMRSGVPVITSQDSAMAEIGKDAALLVDPANHQDIAEKMMNLYKDESLRNKLVEKSRDLASELTWEEAANKFISAVRQAANQKKA